MNIQNKISEKELLNLIHSKNIDDVKLGAIIAIQHMDEEWLDEWFEKNNKRSHCVYNRTERTLVTYKDRIIFIGFRQLGFYSSRYPRTWLQFLYSSITEKIEL